MATLLQDKIKIAKKKYRCDASHLLINECGINELTPEDRLILLKYKGSGFKINPGDIYCYQFLVDGGDHWVFRAIPEIFDLCLKYVDVD